MKKTLFSLIITIIATINLQAAIKCEWIGEKSGTQDFNDVTNWRYEDANYQYAHPTAISNAYRFEITRNTFTLQLTSNCTVDGLVIGGNINFDFNGNTLTTTKFQMQSPSTIDTSDDESELIYANANAGECYINGYTTFNLTNFFYPMNATRPKQLNLRSITLKLTQNTSAKELRFITTSSYKAYLDLNGYNLTCNSFYVLNDNTGFIIPNVNSNLIFDNLTAAPSNVRFADASKAPLSSGIQLKSIQKTGTDNRNVNIVGSVEVSEKISCASGKIAVTGSITLLSEVDGTDNETINTAYVGESAGSITATGGFTVQQYIPGRRVFRFLAHPFSSAIALSQLTDDIDITGSGTGFTGTLNNNPSAFYFDPSAADNTSSGLNPGWKAFTNTTTNSWAKATPALIYIRGAKTEGIDGLAYTPSPVTLDMSGTINTGNQSITLTKGANSDFITVGNPYPSPIQMQSITSSQRSTVGSTFWIFDSKQAVNGGYVPYTWGASYVLPAYAGFATTLTASGTIDFVEAHKTTTSATGIFMDGSDLSDLTLNVFVNDHLFDLTRLIAHEQSQSDKDYFDGGKMENADINFFTLSKNGEKLSIDARPFDLNTERIAMGLFSSKDRTIKIQADPSAFLNEHSVTLIDHYTHKQYNLNEGESVELRIDVNNPKTFGTERLELVIGQLQSHTEKLSQAQVHVYPNPSQSSNAVNVQANSPIQHIALMDVSGRLVWEISPENKSEFMEIPETVLANAGIYFIEITTALGTSSQKHVVQN